MIRFGIVGAGWRSEFFLRVAAACPDRFEVTGVVTTNDQRARRIRDELGCNVAPDIASLLDRPCDFVVTSIPRDANPSAIEQLIDAGMPVLSETPPAADVETMTRLCRWADQGAKIQVAEQYPFQPHHAARIQAIREGLLGSIHEVQASVAHGYHGMALIRRCLGIGFQNAKIRGQRFTGRVIDGPKRNGPPSAEKVVDDPQIICTLDFGDRLGVFDFGGQQYMSYIRGQRFMARGERGEIIDDRATWLAGLNEPVVSTFRRHEAGPEGNLEGDFLKGIQCGERWVYHNPLAPARLSDDEIAVGTCLLKMAEYLNGGDPVYSIHEACQDHYLGLLCAQAADSGQPITTQDQTWSASPLVSV